MAPLGVHVLNICQAAPHRAVCTCGSKTNSFRLSSTVLGDRQALTSSLWWPAVVPAMLGGL